MLIRIALLLALTGAVSGQVGNGCRIRVVAGSPTTDAGDGGPAMSAQLSGASGMAFDRDGNLYIADTFNHKIRRVARDGTITTFAGTGAQGFGGDGGPAGSASLNSPSSVALDANGNVYIADSRNYRLRRVGSDGIIQTVAGTGAAGFNGDGNGGTAQIGYVSAVVVDASGNLYLIDNFRVRRLSSGGVLDTVAGNGDYGDLDRGTVEGTPATAAAIAPRSIAVDAAGTVYIGRIYTIWRVDDKGALRRVAGNGLPAFSDPVSGGEPLATAIGALGGMAVDGAGALYYADLVRRRIGIIGADRKFAGSIDARPITASYLALGPGILAGGDSERVFGYAVDSDSQLLAGTASSGFEGDGGPATLAKLNSPQGLAINSQGNLFIADGANRRVRRVTPDGVIVTSAGNGNPGSDGDGGAASAATLGFPVDLALDASDNLYIADEVRIRRVTPDGTIGGVRFKGQAPVAPLRVSLDAAENLFLTEAARTGFTIARPPDNTPDYHPLTVGSVAVRPDALFRGSGGNVVALAAGGLLDFSLPLRAGLGFVAPQIFEAPTRAVQDDTGNVWVWDSRGLRRLELDGALARILPYALNESFGPLARPPLTEVNGLAADGDGNIYWSGNSRVRVLERPDLCPASYPPEIAFGGVENVASGARANTISPGEVIRIRGANLGPSQAVAAQPDNGRFGGTVAATTVTIGNIVAPLLTASRREVVAVVPLTLASEDAAFVVDSGTGDIPLPFSLPVRPVNPGLFAEIRNEDGSMNSRSNPAHRGSTITLRGTGLGAFESAVPDGQVAAADSLTKVAAAVAVLVGGREAEVLFAGEMANQVAGIVQVRIKLPAEAATGDAIAVELRAAGVASNQVAIALQ
jgi:uncharacterized protein (TIGR03437 family)